jgi:hypothetical protein
LRSPFRHFGSEIAVCGRDDSHVHFLGRQRSDPLHSLVLENSQEFGLGGQRHIANFIGLDKHVQKRIERHVQSRALIDTTRMPQSVANIMRGRTSWYRDNRL